MKRFICAVLCLVFFLLRKSKCIMWRVAQKEDLWCFLFMAFLSAGTPGAIRLEHSTKTSGILVCKTFLQDTNAKTKCHYWHHRQYICISWHIGIGIEIHCWYIPTRYSTFRTFLTSFYLWNVDSFMEDPIKYFPVWTLS